METRRCLYCHTLQQANVSICRSCQRPFPVAQDELVTGNDFVRRPRLPANVLQTPVASPHHAGHSFGLHPEDQPYQSSMIAAAPAAVHGQDSPHVYVPEPASILFPATAEARALKKARLKELSLVRFPKISLPPYYRTRTAFLSQRTHAVLLTLACIFLLLAASIIAFVMIGEYTTNADASMPGQVRSTVSQRGQNIPRLLLQQTECYFAVAADDVSSEQNVVLTNEGVGSLTWSVRSDQPWLVVSPDHGTFTEQQVVAIKVQRKALAPAIYTGRLIFTQQGGHQSVQRMLVAMGVSARAIPMVPAVQPVTSPADLPQPPVVNPTEPVSTVTATVVPPATPTVGSVTPVPPTATAVLPTAVPTVTATAPPVQPTVVPPTPTSTGSSTTPGGPNAG